MALIKGGMPHDIAWDMVDGGMDAEVIAHIVVIGEMEGGHFDWNRLEWKKDP